MTKDIKKSIIGLCISLFLFVLGIVLANTSPWSKIPDEIFQIVIAIIAGLCLIIGFFSSIILLIITIGLIETEVHNKKVDKYTAQIEEKAKNQLPKNVEFSVNIADVNNEEINKILHENIRCKALFDGENVHITFYLSDEVEVETCILGFLYNFDY